MKTIGFTPPPQGNERHATAVAGGLPGRVSSCSCRTCNLQVYGMMTDAHVQDIHKETRQNTPHTATHTRKRHARGSNHQRFHRHFTRRNEPSHAPFELKLVMSIGYHHINPPSEYQGTSMRTTAATGDESTHTDDVSAKALGGDKRKFRKGFPPNRVLAARRSREYM